MTYQPGYYGPEYVKCEKCGVTSANGCKDEKDCADNRRAMRVTNMWMRRFKKASAPTRPVLKSRKKR